jgi:hypothetical protein
MLVCPPPTPVRLRPFFFCLIDPRVLRLLLLLYRRRFFGEIRFIERNNRQREPVRIEEVTVHNEMK